MNKIEAAKTLLEASRRLYDLTRGLASDPIYHVIDAMDEVILGGFGLSSLQDGSQSDKVYSYIFRYRRGTIDLDHCLKGLDEMSSLIAGGNGV